MGETTNPQVGGSNPSGRASIVDARHDFCRSERRMHSYTPLFVSLKASYRAEKLPHGPGKTFPGP